MQSTGSVNYRFEGTEKTNNVETKAITRLPNVIKRQISSTVMRFSITVIIGPFVIDGETNNYCLLNGMKKNLPTRTVPRSHLDKPFRDFAII